MGACGRACEEQQCGSETRCDEQIRPPHKSGNTRGARLEPMGAINGVSNYHRGFRLQSLIWHLR
jgi:hypothetical protein